MDDGRLTDLIGCLAANWRSVCIHQINRVNYRNGFGHDGSTININAGIIIIIIIIIIDEVRLQILCRFNARSKVAENVSPSYRHC